MAELIELYARYYNLTLDQAATALFCMGNDFNEEKGEEEWN